MPWPSAEKPEVCPKVEDKGYVCVVSHSNTAQLSTQPATRNTSHTSQIMARRDIHAGNRHNGPLFGNLP
ncbi:hypothetical protein SAMN05216202_2290 [Pseudomonas mucidolens]|uniref:Uncharacterized protein n=1 Tax=Pseudomonas mucidolens TaxID=46679 RepID=A0A1H2MS83_9PSED|nr:hypothetical protein SAMN05216202_2290 [Pseudomonas mucidolens]SQH33316.1 Uncharacterised protein [Pseudomonas mucidolens]